MVLDESNKRWACLSCIKGHRAAKCSHSDRWLIKVRQSGRPRTRTSACDHPDKNECDCAGIRKCLMVAIPNNQACQCSGDHTCFRGTQLYMTRVDNPDDVPTVAPEILQQRADLSEAFRVGGPEYVNKVYPNYYSGKQKSSTSQGAIHQQPTTSNTSSSQDPTIQQPQSNTAGNSTAEEPTKSCCAPRQRDPQVSRETSNGIKPETLPMAPKPHFEATAGPFPYPGQNQHLGLGSSIGSSSAPWTEPRHREMHTPHNLGDQYNCECGSDCNCLGCHRHPYNQRMRQTVGSILTTTSHRGSIDYGAGPQSPVVTYPPYATNQPMHTPTMQPAMPPTVNSSQYTHYEYDFNDFNELDASFSPDQFGVDYDATTPQAFDSITSPASPPSNLDPNHTNTESSVSSPAFSHNPFAFPQTSIGQVHPFSQEAHYPINPYHNVPTSPPYYQQPWVGSVPPTSPPIYRQ